MGMTGGDNLLPLRHMTSRSSRAIKTGYQRFERPVFDYASKFAPCRGACPAGHNTAWAAFLASKGRFDTALQALREENPFPSITGRVCYHPCEYACNRADYDQPVAINALERALADHATADRVEPAPRRHEESIGIVGAGPAGLTCAYHLVRLGYPVTVYDANDTPGGVLAYGIPAYRLPRDVLSLEVDRLRALGVAFRCGVRVGVDLPFSTVRETHHALFVAPGLGRARTLSIPMPRDPRIQSGVAFLRAVSVDGAHALSGHVVVIGGGDVAVDVARTALRLGAEKVTLCSPEARTEMPAHPAEVDAARHEGIEILDRVAPTRLEAAADGLRLALSRVRHLRAGEDGRVVVEAEREGGRHLRASHLFYAVGQEADLSFLPAPIAREDRLPADAWGRTPIPGVFAGGDVTGVYGVSEAIGGGKRAAIGMDAWLQGIPVEEVSPRVAIGRAGVCSMRAYSAFRRGETSVPCTTEVSLEEINLDYFPPAARIHTREVDPALRIGSFVEVVHSLTAEEAVAEARRCFNCGTCNMCGNCFTFCPDASVFRVAEWGFAIDLDHCKGCGVCVEECPREAMTMVPESEMAREGSR